MCFGSIIAQQVDGSGATVDGKMYWWYDVPNEEDPTIKDMYGWYDGGNDPVSGVTLAPGEGIWVEGVRL